MHTLTPDLLDRFPYSRYADARSISRGRSFYQEGRVRDIELVSRSHAICEVSGDTAITRLKSTSIRNLGSLISTAIARMRLMAISANTWWRRRWS